ncbi:protein translocase subunit SecD [Wolbachia endosymbiont of Howardula sp.]|uniref:protein translocase subunit SecD n=1 Tax=Wolbachia endosymbiont of Howardula sp. TaxID=2916816 RepID=UPI00217E6237|nr:protein translocase subunit SecD [Wolbachia endosymbiont of Howardula sp.]UWI83103.1 protein translocase subunit SecD [Wolbachia endosymbiont of Howardula sp.]
MQIGFKIKTFSILIICLVLLYIVLPNFFDNKFFISQKKMSLGLDLRGGSSLLLRIDIESYFKEKLYILADEIQAMLLTVGLIPTIQIQEDMILILDSNINNSKKYCTLVKAMNSNLEINKKDSSMKISYQQQYKTFLIHELVLELITNIQRRLDILGTKEISVQTQGTDKILVQIPGIHNIKHVKSLLGKMAKLSFHFINENVMKIEDIDDTTTILLRDSFGQVYPILRKTVMKGESLINVSVIYNTLGYPTIHFKFDDLASKRFARVSTENLGKPLAIILDNIIITIPIIREPILNGEGEINGNFSEKDAIELAQLLRAGAMPASLSIVEEKNIGPNLGRESIHSAKISVIISVFTIICFIIMTYGKLGVLATCSMFFNIILILSFLTILEVTLTLPGIAGIVLTIGMSVDSNILIFERIREEIKLGKRKARAIEEGFKNTLTTILDANLTTLIASGIMFCIGINAMKSFAITLSIGITCSMFSALILTKLLIELYVKPNTLRL